MGRRKMNKPEKAQQTADGAHWAHGMPVAEANPTLWIESSLRSHDSQDAELSCLLTWGDLQWYAPVTAVRQTSVDLMTSAAYAELMATLIKMGLDSQHITAMVSDAIHGALNGRIPYQGMLGTDHTISVMPSASSVRKAGVVVLQHGSLGGVVSPAGAREMAGHWMQVATGSECDEITATALRDVLSVDREQTSGLFAYMRALRDVDGSQLEDFRQREGDRMKEQFG